MAVKKTKKKATRKKTSRAVSVPASQVVTFRNFQQQAQDELMEEAKNYAAKMLKDRWREIEAARAVVRKLEEDYQRLLDAEVTEDTIRECMALPGDSGIKLLESRLRRR